MHANHAQSTGKDILLGSGECEKVLKCDLLKIFEGARNSQVDPYYLDRTGRNRFAASQLNKLPVSSILNLGGGGHRHLQQSLGRKDIMVYEMDIQGDCDLRVNLDQLQGLPFDDRSFDVVCAFDVLEHLENFHLINDEMYRVARDYVLISLPNSAAEIFYDAFWNRPQIESNKNRGTYSIFYGLPLVPPDDRHRWWLYFQDIVRFYYYFSLKNNADLEFWVPKLNFKKRLFQKIFGKHLYYTFFCPHVWVKIKKRQS